MFLEYSVQEGDSDEMWPWPFALGEEDRKPNALQLCQSPTLWGACLEMYKMVLRVLLGKLSLHFSSPCLTTQMENECGGVLSLLTYCCSWLVFSHILGRPQAKPPTILFSGA